ncbi:hypothetical protein EDC30_10759 [Paucimonas lemoignei]|uniref:MASE1 domain-containing protein n=1 Tax=Paucimonas lemoignei TaxID=29443 RepID=A0A4R3HT79_PAULE|nr:hypothetical protein [Paucimonas lemoignei]TCS36242.1 hypothetical protein EDC30_10759 [Paucimonas lemoignei]
MNSSLKLNASMAAGSAIVFLLVFLANEWLFNSDRFELVRGVNWIYLPAGMRLLCTLLFGGAGAIGVLLASWITCVFYFFPDDPLRSFAGGIASAAAPYLVYKMAQHLYGLQTSLVNLNAKRLVLLSVAYSVASPVLHHFWLLLRGEPLTSSFFVMVLGDLLGTLVVIYTMKLILSVIPMPGPYRKNRAPSA